MEIKRLIIKNKTLSIIKDKIPFKIDKNFCQNYLILRCIKYDHNILIKCNYIFNMIIRNSNEHLCNNNTISFYKRYNNNWSLKFIENNPIINYNGLYYNEHLYINCIKDYSLKELLKDEQKYKLFLHYWSDQFSYDNLFNLLDEISIKLQYPLPYEVIDNILLIAYSSYNHL